MRVPPPSWGLRPLNLVLPFLQVLPGCLPLYWGRPGASAPNSKATLALVGVSENTRRPGSHPGCLGKCLERGIQLISLLKPTVPWPLGISTLTSFLPQALAEQLNIPYLPKRGEASCGCWGLLLWVCFLLAWRPLTYPAPTERLPWPHPLLPFCPVGQ